MKNFGILFLTTVTFFFAYPATACEMRDLIYTNGEYEFTFDSWDQIDEDQRSATMFPFKIINKKANLSFEGIIGYGNGYSYPQVGINVCANKDNEYKRLMRNRAVIPGLCMKLMTPIRSTPSRQRGSRPTQFCFPI